MDRSSRIADEIRGSLTEILASWREARNEIVDEEAYRNLLGGIERITMVFTEFLRSPDTVETFTKGGAVRELVGEIAGYQHELGRESVGVMEDFAALRRVVWRSVEKSVDLSTLDGAEVARFFVKLMQATDWVVEAALEAFDAIARADMEEALGRAAATDLLTGLPDRDLFTRLLLPQAVTAHHRFSIIIFDVASFSETVAAGEVAQAREALRVLADAVRAFAPEGAVFARFGDDEICAILPDEGSEAAYGIAERVLERIREHGGFEVDAGVAEYPAHGRNAGELVTETLKALKMAKRVGGSGIVVAR
ncbi:MAG: GGDEF domain-containing protein [Rubrobacteraceae bacterium]|nr:GGDEF domain-containing protein [Rubrobacter sp.]